MKGTKVVPRWCPACGGDLVLRSREIQTIRTTFQRPQYVCDRCEVVVVLHRSAKKRDAG